MARSKKKLIPEEMMRPLTMGVVLIMIVTAIVLQIFFQRSDFFEKKIATTPEDFNQFINDIVPNSQNVFSDAAETFPTENIVSEEFEFFGRDSQSVRAYVTKPEGKGPFPVFVIVHDAPASQRSTQRVSENVAERLSQEHTAIVVVVDWRESEIGQNDLSDVLSTIDWVKTMEATDDEKVVVVGIGYGAYLGFLATEETEIGGLVSIGGYYDPARVFDALNKKRDTRDSSVSEKANQFVVSMRCETSLDPTACLSQLSVQDFFSTTTPLLVIHNVNDSVIPFSQIENSVELSEKNNVTIKTVQAASGQHDLFGNAGTPEFEQTQEYFNEWAGMLFGTVAIDTPVKIVVPAEKSDSSPEDRPTDESKKSSRTPIFRELDSERLIDNASDL